MKVLLVDDDAYIIQALNEKIDWYSIGVNQVFSAYNMKQAQDILKEQAIDLLISDIEMPQGSGLELLAWVREENLTTQAIFLTNYADFNYAQKAIELQSFEYYLKPIDFERFGFIIQKAIKNIQNNHDYIHTRLIPEDNFWSDYLRKPNAHSLDTFLEDAKKQQIQNQCFQPVILTLQLSYEDSLTTGISWSKQLKQQVVTFTENNPTYHLASFFKLNQYAEKYFFLFKKEEPKKSTHFFHSLHQFLAKEHPIQLLLGEEGNLYSILQAVQDLLAYSQQYIGHQGKIYTPSETIYQEGEEKNIFPPEMVLLSSNDLQLFLLKYYPYLTKEGMFSNQLLKRLQLDIFQKIGTLLDRKGILAHRLFQDPRHDFLQQRCLNSIEDWLCYIEYYSQTAGDYIQFLDSQQSVSKVITDYIDHHFSEELNRKFLSDLVFISPDHLARLFKQETGKTLINYITDKRIEEAKKLLSASQATVYLIADQVGYDNYSYFSKIFKKMTGLTPLEYRQIHQNTY
ncbi:response regulator transcription factor [Streptococcus ovis]|uniref:response regulator transcription factor n=1 Tax=Streptococcus ovis TaxID=82806 RepID=UPI000362692F|nr:helix-turn-helix domain-containing protein [Streptococcus ovis]